MKKFLLTLICVLNLCSHAIAQQCEPGKSELFFASSLRYNNLIEEENILKTGCIKVTKKSSLMIVNQVQTLESALLIEKYIANIEFKNLKGLNNADWLSNILIKDLFKSRFSKVLEEEEKETQDLINQKFGMNKFDYQWKPKFEDTEKLLNYVGQKYKKEYAFYKDEYDNFALIYIVLSNKPELINYSYSAYDDKSIWIKVNKDKYSPLHFIRYSP